ncbi:hypothetical protein BCR44DRAFT_189530 [Catenaria anguillulae PL171]|uniref:Uncharacterized protein n=1 Tax=Catenaria anguillulae PL171 TaxID=765915 RepID=A0A1Y2HWJ4_9FUNG|nr:hypothetical protein BCR44DRAFT_189530 [Catenaria anguillulae PL171]
MVSSTSSAAPSAWGAWGSQPAPLDPLLTRIRSGQIHSLVLFSSQRIRLDDWPRLFDALADAESLGHPVTSLSLSGHAIPELAAEAIQRYMKVAQKLSHLAVLGAAGVDSDLAPWANGLSEGHGSELTSLDLSGKRLGGPVPMLTQMLVTLKESLKELVIYGNSCPELDFSLVGSNEHQLTALTTLDLAASQLTPAALQQWIQLCPNLKSLILSENPLLGGGAGDWLASAKLDHLESIDLSDCNITDEQLSKLLDASRFPKVSKILVAGGSVTGSTLSTVGPSRSVEALSLARCPLGQALDGEALSRAFPALQSLDMGECRSVTVDTLVGVLKHSPALKSVTLRGISCVGLAALLDVGGVSAMVDMDLVRFTLCFGFLFRRAALPLSMLTCTRLDGMWFVVHGTQGSGYRIALGSSLASRYEPVLRRFGRYDGA